MGGGGGRTDPSPVIFCCHTSTSRGAYRPQPAFRRGGVCCSGDVILRTGRFCHGAAPSLFLWRSRSVLRACPHRKAPIGLEHALSCLTVQLTRNLTFGPGVVLLVCLFAIVCVCACACAVHSAKNALCFVSQIVCVRAHTLFLFLFRLFSGSYILQHSLRIWSASSASTSTPITDACVCVRAPVRACARARVCVCFLFFEWRHTSWFVRQIVWVWLDDEFIYPVQCPVTFGVGGARCTVSGCGRRTLFAPHFSSAVCMNERLCPPPPFLRSRWRRSAHGLGRSSLHTSPSTAICCRVIRLFSLHVFFCGGFGTSAPPDT